MNTVRREKIRAYVEENRVVTLEQLSALLPEVSLMTLHRDLNYLQEQGCLTKMRGGARYTPPDSLEAAFAARAMANPEAKKRIAAKALPLLEGTDSLYLDAGTTTMALARLLGEARMSVITSGPNIALELARGAGLTIHLCGGQLNKNNLTVSGPSAMETVRGVNIETAVLVASGFSPEGGFTCGMESEARLKELAAAKARHVILLIDSSKLDKILPYTFGTLEEIDTLVTDRERGELPGELITAAAAAGVTVV